MDKVFKELETVIELNGNEVPATVRISLADDEDFTIDDIDFENEEEKTRFQRKLNRGEITATVIMVEVNALGESDTAVLGSVLVEKPEDVDSAVEEYEMISEATDAVVTLITEKYETLKPYFEA